jgi:hypothetical protein
MRDDAQLDLKIGAMRPNHGSIVQAILLVLPKFCPTHKLPVELHEGRPRCKGCPCLLLDMER